ncbi:MAG TPA: hypothetical protein DEH25_03130 [Chloroflexi bacterium]|nr:hypothetical protein [Chloroflexota bacterium]
MMNLDDHEVFAALDGENLLAEIESLPDQLAATWGLAQTLDLPAWRGLRQVVIAGMGVSALGGDLLAAYAASLCALPVIVLRDYTLPAWAYGPETLVICASYAGYTEEVLAILEQAVGRSCRFLTITTGGLLAEAARQTGATLWLYERSERTSQFYAALGYAFGLPLAVFARLGLIPDPVAELAEAVASMRAQQVTLGAAVPIRLNEAKRLAGQCLGRWLTVWGSDHLVPVARYWKAQLNLIAKTPAQFEALPEGDHNTLAGVSNPAGMLGNTMMLFLRGKSCQPRNQLRVNLTKERLMLEGLGTDFFNAKGETVLAQMFSALHFGDYLAYYLALAYGVDPNPTGPVEELKAHLLETA